ncbi:MAG: sel1 repeat family protein [Candidatus Electrothrix sp. AR4]|nr:sel1 repeat family protein [Candidatus Electrothrix sp. AR4]
MRRKHNAKSGYIFFSLLFAVQVLFMSVVLIPAGSLKADDQLTKRIRLLADQGDREAQFSMGLRYDLGDGVVRDPELAVHWFAKAAAAGVSGACLYLGMKYEFGAGVKQDKEAAINWYERAAVQGWPQAAFLFGSLYLTRSNEDFLQGCAWLFIAAEQEYPGAEQTRLQKCSGGGNGFDRKVMALSHQLRQQMLDAK